MDGFKQQTDGVPGIGKTQLCLQLCANSHMPSALGGLGGGALFIGLFFFQLGATHMETSQRAYDAQTQKDHFHGQGMKKWWKQQFHTHRRVHQRCC